MTSQRWECPSIVRLTGGSSAEGGAAKINGVEGAFVSHACGSTCIYYVTQGTVMYKANKTIWDLASP